MTTGNIYSQVFNSQSGRFEELPTGIIPIQVISTSGNIFSSKLLPYRGISIPTFNTERILMYPIDIGSLNYNSGDGITLGYSNFIYNISPTGELGTAPGSVCLGEGNLTSGAESVTIGNKNTKYNSWYSYSFGHNNIEKDTAQISIIGRDNAFSGALHARVLGAGNFFIKSHALPSSGIDVYFLNVLGNSNILASGARYINLLGNNNSLTNQSNNLAVFGNQNITSNISGDYNLILGQSNIATTANDIYVLGFNNTNRQSYDSYVLGKGNTLDSGNINSVFGRFNQSATASGNNLIGNFNILNGDLNNIYGNGNDVSLDALNNIIFGNNNNFTGSNSNSIFGSLNSDQASNASLSIGNNNLTISNANSYIIGENNQYTGNTNSYVLGNQNYAGNSNGSFVVGNSNSVSGFQNYVIGNNNIIRSGDFNSILIGISHQPATGDFNYKVASVNIASVNNTIEVSPSDIKLTSANRPQINGENIIIQSEFDTISNALVQGPIFSTNTFQDPNYDKLADRIIFPYFVYDSGASLDSVSISQELTGTSFLFLNNFNIFSATSYVGPDFNVIFGAHTNTALSGALSTPSWIVTDNSTSGIYYINTGTLLNTTPQSGWTITGFEDGNGVIYTGKTANLQVNLKIGTRSGFLSSSSSSFGTFYIPILY